MKMNKTPIRGVYLKRGNRTIQERNMELAVANFLEKKIKNDASFPFEGLRNIYELKTFYVKYCKKKTSDPISKIDVAKPDDELPKLKFRVQDMKKYTSRPMKNIPFVLWAILTPIVSCICSYINYPLEIFSSHHFIVILLELTLYFYFSHLLYER